jgi:putative ABC transport system permease protein
VKKVRALLLRIAEVWSKERRDGDLDDEMSSLLELETEAGVARGMSAESARREARMRMNLEATKEQARDQRGLPTLESFLQDIRYGLRMLRKSPGFAAVALLTVALGIGANTAMFSAVNAVLLRRLPFRDADRLVMIWEKAPGVQGFLAERLPVRLQSYLYWKEQAQSFEDMSAALFDAANMSGIDQPQHVERAQVSSNFFSLLGVGAEIGRTFSAEETNGAASEVAILSYGTYERRFGKADDILQRKVQVDGVWKRIVGVLPRDFHLTGMWEGFDQAKPEIWTPLNVSRSQPLSDQQQNKLIVFGRMKPGVTLATARSEIGLLESRLVEQFPKVYETFTTNVFSLSTEDVAKNLRRSLLVLQLAVGFVLLIACVNVANLLLARAAGREREIAVRLALGATPSRMIRQMVSESLVFSVVGAVPGMALAWCGIQAVAKLAPSDVRGLHEMSLDVRVLAFTTGITVIAGVLFGLAPALHAAGHKLNEMMNRGGRSAHSGLSQRLRTGLVIGEVALALAPLAGAGLMIRTLHAWNALDIGIRAENVVTGEVTLPEIQYKDRGQVLAFCEQLMDRVRGLREVESAALAGSPPLRSVNFSTFHLDGEAADREQTVDVEAVSDGYFRTMGSALLQGRDFTRAEAEQDADVAIVTRSLARELWPGQDPIGKVMVFGDQQPKRRVIVGIVPDTRILMLGPEVHQNVYYPTRSLRRMTLIVRSRGDAAGMEKLLAEQVRSIDANLPIYGVQPLTQVLRNSLAQQRFTMGLLVSFATLALILAAIGLYGVMAYSVAQRTQEIGIRMALGARAADVLRMVLRQGLVAVVAGIAAGIAGSILLTRAMASLVFGVRTYDPATFAIVAAGVLLVAIAASYIPARRAAKVDPMVALRRD